MIPMEMTMPSQSMNPNILAGLTGDILKKVTKNITNTMSDHASEALQQGVPYGHILEQLIKMSPVSAGMAIGQDMVAGNGGKPPQNTPMQGKGQNPQPPNQTPGVRNNSQQDGSVTVNDSTGAQSVPQQSNGQASPDGNAILSQLLAAMQQNQGAGQQAQMPSFLGIKPSAQNQVLLTEAAKNQQALAGKTPMQIGDLQKIIAGVGGKQLEANAVGPTQYEQAQLKAGGFQAQADMINKDQERIAQEETTTKAAFDAQLAGRGEWSKHFTPKQLLSDFKNKMNDLSDQRQLNKDKLLDLYGNHPNLKLAKSVSAGTSSEPTATNPTTGKKVVYRDGKWQPLTK